MRRYKVYYHIELHTGLLFTTARAKNQAEALRIASKETMINSKYLTCNINKVTNRKHGRISKRNLR